MYKLQHLLNSYFYLYNISKHNIKYLIQNLSFITRNKFNKIHNKKLSCTFKSLKQKRWKFKAAKFKWNFVSRTHHEKVLNKQKLVSNAAKSTNANFQLEKTRRRICSPSLCLLVSPSNTFICWSIEWSADG